MASCADVKCLFKPAGVKQATLRNNAQQGKVCFRYHWQIEHVVLTQSIF